MKGKINDLNKMKGNKIKAILLIAVFIISTIAMAIPVSATSELTVVLSGIPETATNPSIELETWTGGTAEWTTEAPADEIGDYSVKLTGESAAKVFYGETLETLAAIGTLNMIFRFYFVSGSMTPFGILYLDTDLDGVVDVLLYAKTNNDYIATGTWHDAKMQVGHWSPRGYDEGVITSPVTIDGVEYLFQMGAECEMSLSAWVAKGSVWANTIVMYVAQASCEWPPTVVAYVDDITIDGVPYALEPSGNVDDTVTVSGTSATPGGEIEVYWDSVKKPWDGTAGLLESDWAVGYDYSIDIIVPDGIVGDHYVIVKDVEAPDTALTTLIVESEITLDPTTALEGDTITVEGTGFDADKTITIKFDGTQETTIPTPVETNATGSFSCKFDVPETIKDSVIILASDATNDAEATLTIGATIALEPAEGPSGTVVDITGIGFTATAGKTVDITIDGTAAEEIAPILTNSDGTFSGQFIVPTLDVDEYTVTAEDENTISGTSDFEVTGTTAITLTPTSGAPDSEVAIEGANFTAMAGKVVTIKFDGLELTETFLTNTDGSFEGTVIVPSLVAADYTVRAEDSNELYATKVFKVVFTTLAVSPSEGPTGTKVLVMGGGYTDNKDFNVTMDGVLMVDGTGTLTGTGSLPEEYVFVPTLPVGDYTITVMDEDGITGTISFEVTETTEIILTPDGGPVDYPITIETNYFTAEDGIDITVTLYNETAGERDYEKVFLTTDIDEATGFTSIKTNATGSFEGTFSVPPLAIGDYIINATDANGLTVETSFSVVEVYIEIHTLSTEYDPGDTVSFYVNATFAFDLEIDIEDPTGYPFTTIDCPKTDGPWSGIGDFYVVPYVDASFELLSDAVTGSWNWTALDSGEEVANGTFTVGEPVGPQPDLPAETTGQEAQDSTGATKTSFEVGETVNAYSEIANVGNDIETILIVVQFKDPNNVVYAPCFLTVYLDPGEDFGYAPGLTILPGYTTGTWTAKINLFTTWLSLDGVPIGLPVTIEFEVI